MRRTRFAIAGALVAAMAIAVPAGAVGPRAYEGSVSDGTAVARPTVDTAYALVQLKGAPLSTDVKTKPAPGKKIDFNAGTTKSARAQLSALRNDFKQWLRANAPAAQVTGSWDISLNAVSVKLNGTDLATIKTSPLVVQAELQGLYYKTADDPDLGIISALEAWEAFGGSAAAGEGVKVAVVDSGIDATHPCFADDDYAAPAGFPRGQLKYTNEKVIVAKVFYNKLNQSGFDAEAVDSHGTHVAGTIACNFQTPASVSGVDIPYDISGVAPRAFLGNYNVFPGNVESARSEDILNALEAAYADGMDVANMSLGGGASGIQDLLTMAVDNLDRANMVVAVSAGNEGPGHYTVGSPGSAARALTAGASTVPHFVGAPLTVGGATYGVAAGDFATVTADLTALLAVVPADSIAGQASTLGRACNASTPALPSLTGKIALISRGACTFSQKISNAQNAGAVAAIVVNNVAGDPTAMGFGGLPVEPTIPAYMASLAGRVTLMAAHGASATIGAGKSYFLTTNVDIMAGFSSQGPTDVDFRVKPDLVAPGVNVLSSIPQSYCAAGVDCFAFFGGTSMASPHLAGAAAIVRQQHLDWPAWAVRSAIVNSADIDVLKWYMNGTTIETDVNVSGAGRLNLESAVAATVALDPVSVSFGAVPSGSGVTKTFAVRVRNASMGTATLSFTIEPYGAASGVAFSVAPAGATITAGATTTVTVTAIFDKGAAAGDKQAWLVVREGGAGVAHAAVYAFVK
ncbi:MAG: S8 family serine peptidase [Chloroflexota bacterium]